MWKIGCGCDLEWLFKYLIVVPRSVVILQCTGLVVSQNETKGDIKFKHGGLVGKDLVKVLYNLLRLRGRQTIVIPVQEPVLAAKSSADLMPVATVLENRTLLDFREIGDGSWLFLPDGT